MLNKVRQSKTHFKVHVFTYVWNLKNKMDEYNKSRNKLRHIEQASGLPVGRRVGGRTDRGKGCMR